MVLKEIKDSEFVDAKEPAVRVMFRRVKRVVVDKDMKSGVLEVKDYKAYGVREVPLSEFKAMLEKVK